MVRSLAMAFGLVLVATVALAAQPAEVKVELMERHLDPGVRDVVLTVYATADGDTAIATQTRSVHVDGNGSFATPLASLAGDAPRWISVRVPPGPESRRVAIGPRMPGDVKVQVVTDAAITANGIIESIAQGFRFPDATVQTTALSVGATVPAVVSSTSSLAGVSPAAARADHVHSHGNLNGGTLHATATTSVAGFLSATDKTKIDTLPTYARTIFVSGGGTSTANGTALFNALNGISGNSVNSPYLLKLEPGIYDLGTNQLTMKSYVDIEGSGENTTFIQTVRGSATATSAAAAILGAANAELRNLTVTNTSTSLIAMGFFASGSGGVMRLRNVTINVNNGQTTTYGIYVQSSASVVAQQIQVTVTPLSNSAGTGVFATGSTIDFSDSTIKATASGSNTLIGVQTNSSTATATLDSCTIIATGATDTTKGVVVNTGNVTVTNCILRAETAGTRIVVETSASASSKLKVSHSLLLAFSTGTNPSELAASKGTSSTLAIGASMIDGASFGTPKCVHVYDDSMNDLNNTCPASVG